MVASQFTVQHSQAKIHLKTEEASCSIQDPAQVRNYMHDKLDSLPEFCTVRLGSQELCLKEDLIRQGKGGGDGESHLNQIRMLGSYCSADWHKAEH